MEVIPINFIPAKISACLYTANPFQIANEFEAVYEFAKRVGDISPLDKYRARINANHVSDVEVITADDMVEDPNEDGLIFVHAFMPDLYPLTPRTHLLVSFETKDGDQYELTFLPRRYAYNVHGRSRGDPEVYFPIMIHQSETGKFVGIPSNCTSLIKL